MNKMPLPPPPPPPPPSPPENESLASIQEEGDEEIDDMDINNNNNNINNTVQVLNIDDASNSNTVEIMMASSPPPPPPSPPTTESDKDLVDQQQQENEKLQRLSAPQVLSHNNLSRPTTKQQTKGIIKSSSTSPTTTIIKSNKTERRRTKYRTNTRQSMVVKPGELRRRRFTFNGSQKDELYSIFTLLDLDMDGRLMPEEVYVAMAAVGITPTEIIKKAVRKRLPKSAYYNGIEFETFTRIIKSTLTAQPVQRRDLQMLLDHYSHNDDGTIDGGQLRRLLQIPTAANTQLSKKETNQVFAELNLSNDGLIEFGSYVDDVSDGFQRMLDEVPMGRVELTM